MSEHATRAMLENIEQNLVELMADFLDSDSLKLDEAIALINDPAPREESELHVRMANAAFNEYKKTVLSSTPAGEDVEALAEGIYGKDSMVGKMHWIAGYKAALQNKVPVECYVEALEKIAKLYHADRTCSLPAQGYNEKECEQIGIDDYAAQIAIEALKNI